MTVEDQEPDLGGYQKHGEDPIKGGSNVLDFLEHLFTHHPPDETKLRGGMSQVERYQHIREAGLSLALDVWTLVPPGSERGEAIKAIRQAVMWANAGISCCEAEVEGRSEA